MLRYPMLSLTFVTVLIIFLDFLVASLVETHDPKELALKDKSAQEYRCEFGTDSTDNPIPRDGLYTAHNFFPSTMQNFVDEIRSIPDQCAQVSQYDSVKETSCMISNCPSNQSKATITEMIKNLLSNFYPETWFTSLSASIRLAEDTNISLKDCIEEPFNAVLRQLLLVQPYSKEIINLWYYKLKYKIDISQTLCEYLMSDLKNDAAVANSPQSLAMNIIKSCVIPGVQDVLKTYGWCIVKAASEDHFKVVERLMKIDDLNRLFLTQYFMDAITAAAYEGRSRMLKYLMHLLNPNEILHLQTIIKDLITQTVKYGLFISLTAIIQFATTNNIDIKQTISDCIIDTDSSRWKCLSVLIEKLTSYPNWKEDAILSQGYKLVLESDLHPSAKKFILEKVESPTTMLSKTKHFSIHKRKMMDVRCQP